MAKQIRLLKILPRNEHKRHKAIHYSIQHFSLDDKQHFMRYRIPGTKEGEITSIPCAMAPSCEVMETSIIFTVGTRQDRVMVRFGYGWMLFVSTGTTCESVTIRYYSGATYPPEPELPSQG